MITLTLIFKDQRLRNNVIKKSNGLAFIINDQCSRLPVID